MSTHAALISSDPIYGSWLKDKLGAGVKLNRVKFEDSLPVCLLKLEELERVDLLMVEFESARMQRSIEVVEGFLDRFPDIPVIALGSRVDSSILLKAMRAGASDFIDIAEKDEVDVSARIGKVLRRAAQNSAGGKGQGQAYVVLSGAPDAGVPFLAVHLALALQQATESGQRVLLIDASFPHGSSLVFLNANQEYNLNDALADAQRCDQTLIDTAFTRHASGIFVLSQAEDLLSPSTLSVQALEGLLNTLRLYFTHIVMAADAVLSMPVLGILMEQAAHTLLLTDQSVLRSRQSRQLVHALVAMGAGADRIKLVVDNYQKRQGLEPDKLSALLKLPLMAAMTVNPATRSESMNTGESLFKLAPRDPYVLDVKRIASDLMRQPVVQNDHQPANTGGLFGRLFR